MSYILDALRKSEQERQVAAGHGSGLLMPAPTEQRPAIGRPAIWLVASLVVLTLVGINWWWWSRQSQAASPVSTPAPIAAPVAKAELPALQTTTRQALPSPVAEVPAIPAAIAVQPARKPPTVVIPPAPPAAKPSNAHTQAADKPPRTPPAAPVRPAEASQPPKAAPSNDPPAGLPAVSISGYIKDETGGNLAIINDKLVREGEEISPGLRLEKVDGEHAVLNYRGQRFRR